MWVKQLEHESAEQNRTEELYFLTEKRRQISKIVIYFE